MTSREIPGEVCRGIQDFCRDCVDTAVAVDPDHRPHIRPQMFVVVAGADLLAAAAAVVDNNHNIGVGFQDCHRQKDLCISYRHYSGMDFDVDREEEWVQMDW